MSFVLCFYFLWPAEINARGDEKQEISLVWPKQERGVVQINPFAKEKYPRIVHGKNVSFS